ncbi:AEC family transporter [Candidatus Hodarchaeum mangrovi]
MGIIFLGFILKKAKIATEEHGKFLARLAFYITIPAVIFITITSIEINFSLLSFPVIILIYSLILWGLTYFLILKNQKIRKGCI